jgi:hypothetical protein
LAELKRGARVTSLSPCGRGCPSNRSRIYPRSENLLFQVGDSQLESARAGEGCETPSPHPDARSRSHRPSPTRGEGLRAFSNIFSLPRFCDRATCKRTEKCRGNAERCLALYSECVPIEAREFVVDLMTSRELGYSFEEAMRRDKEGARAFAAWTSVNTNHSSWPDLIRPSMKRLSKRSLSMDCRVKPGNDERSELR